MSGGPPGAGDGPALGLDAVLRSEHWAGRVRVLGGRTDGAGVRAAHLLALGDPPPRSPGGLLALAASPVRDGASAWQLDALLRRAADAGAVAVLLPSDADLPPTTQLLCSRLSLCVLGTAAPVLELVTAAAVLLAVPEVATARAVLAVQAAVADGRVTRPPALAALLGRVLGVPVSLLDSAGGLIAGAQDPPLPRLGEPVVQRWADPAGGAARVLARPVLLAGVRTAQRWWVAVAPTDREDAAEAVLTAAAAVMSGWLASERLGAEREARARAELLADVLRRPGEPGAELRQRCAAAGWPLEGWHVGVRVGAVSSVDTAGLREDVVRAFAGAGVDVVVAEHGEGWSCWWTSSREPTAERVRELAGAVRAAHQRLEATAGCWTGVGRPHPGPAGLADTLAEAADAATLAAGRPRSGRFLHADQLGVAQTLLAWTRTSTFEPAARSLLEPLGGPGSELVRTLSTYLDTESSLVESAAVLGVHRNTVAARVARVEQLLGVDLHDRDERLALQLACRALLDG